MCYSVPKYIKAANIADSEIQFTWDDWKPRLAYGRGSEEVMGALSRVTLGAKVAMGIGIYEWIVYRFDALSDDLLPTKFAEAAWCGNISRAYLNYIELDRRNWRGPVRGPLWSAITILNEMIFFAEEDAEPALKVAWLSNLAIHVLRDPAPFKQWRGTCVDRLIALYSAPESADFFEDLFSDETNGAVVPREVLDPEFDLKVEMTPTLIESFLRCVDYRSNPFLKPPEVMLEEGFDGIPYTIQRA